MAELLPGSPFDREVTVREMKPTFRNLEGRANIAA
jgi:hypothetical protein